VSSKIGALEPDDGKPLPDWLAPSLTRMSEHDPQPRPARADRETADIVRQAEQAIAGVPLGPAGDGGLSVHADALAKFVVARIGVAASVLREGLEAIRGAVAAHGGPAGYLRNLGAALRRNLRRDQESGLRFRLRSIAAHPNVKLCAALGAVALVVSLVLVKLPARIGSLTPSSDFPGTPARQASAPADAPASEERPAAGIGLEFSRANIRYCTFQQIRLEALGPVTEGADLVVFNALVEDWNARCTRYRYRPTDKDAVDSEAAGRRALLEVEGRAFMNGWRRKIVATAQQRPASAAPGESPALVQTAADPSSVPTMGREAVERLPLLITSGRAATDESDRDTGLSLRAPSLALLRADVAMRVQQRLNQLGYTISPVDGTWGTMSRNALRRFKEANGLLGNDAFDAETVTRLFSTSAVTAAASRQRDDGEATIETAYPPPPAAGMNPLNRADGQRIQQRLTELGYYTGRGDGAWGVASHTALRSFKVANGLSNDDEWNALAEAALFDEQAVRAADAAVGSTRNPVPAPAASVAVPLPPKRPPPPMTAAKTTEPAPPAAPHAAPRPPGLIPAQPRAPAAALRPSP
jgi:peptidoglycan hydrolase-like protein with peptidoglycan-binding domain